MAIWRIESKKAAVLNGIITGILKQAWPVLAESITHKFNCALRSWIYPRHMEGSGFGDHSKRTANGSLPSDKPFTGSGQGARAYNRDEDPCGHGLANVD